jgi:hypothetical protein
MYPWQVENYLQTRVCLTPHLYPVVEQPVGLSPSHGEETRLVLALLQRLPPAQQCHGPRQLPVAEHDGFLF